MERCVILCVGNSDRGDDAVGRAVAALLREAGAPEIVECPGESGAVLDALEKAGAAIIVDAALSGASPGTVRRFEIGGDGPPLRLNFGWSSHGLGLAEALGVARALGELPAVCVLFVIEGESYAPGAPLSEAARAGAAEAARLILRELPSIRRSAAPLFSTGGDMVGRGDLVGPCPQGGKTLYE